MLEELKKTFDNNKKLGIQMISDYFIGQYHIKTIEEGKVEMFYYKDGIYTRAEKLVKNQLSELLGDEYSIHNKNEVLNQIQAKTYVERADFQVDKYLINLNNGTFDLKTGNFLPHSPLNLFFTKIETDYDPEAKSPMIDHFLHELLPENDVELLKEWFGYCLFRDYFIKKALIMTGEKNTGKTTVIDVFVSILGLENISGVSLQAMAIDKFSVSDMYNKHANIYDDMSASDVKDGGRFKMVTGRSPISAEYKHGNRFQFYNYAKLTFACNRIPNVEDNDDDAYFERWIVVKFQREIAKKDKFLLDKITIASERSGMLNQMLIALNKIIVNQRFTYNKNHEEIKTEMLKSGSPVASFTYDCMQESLGNWISKADLHFYFSLYAKENSLPHVEIKKFGKELGKYAKYCTEGNRTSIRGWNNVTIDDKFKQKYEDTKDAIDKAEFTRRADANVQRDSSVGEDSEEETPGEESDSSLRNRLNEVV